MSLVLFEDGDVASGGMVGDALLVAPVVRPDDRVTVSLPAGEWVDFHTGERHGGPTRLDRTVPLCVRAGAALPVREPDDHAAPATPDSLALRCWVESGRTVATRRLHDRGSGELTDLRVVVDADRERVTVETGAGAPAFDREVAGWSGSTPTVVWDDERVAGERLRTENGGLVVERSR